MFSNLAAKAALKKVGLSSDSFDFSSASSPLGGASDSARPRRQPNKLRKNPPPPKPEGDDDDDGGWASWLSVKSLPLTVHPWLAPPPPPVEVARVPNVGDPAPRDRAGTLDLGAGQRTLIVFLRCAGCAFAQKTFLHLRTLANRHAGSIRCVAVSHSSAQATKKWLDMLGGPWNVDVIIDEERAVYAAWGLGLGGVWYLFHPAAQVQGWKEKGWLGDKVAGAMEKSGVEPTRPPGGLGKDEDEDEDGVATAMGSKWQEAGAFAVDGRGTVIWGNKALRADDVMNLDEGTALLAL